ncbi:MAG: mevalonate kinase family protein [bacterium]
MTVETIAPGRICLFGEHQDFLGLWVIASAIDLHIHIKGKKIKDKVLKIHLPDIGEKEEIDLEKEIVYIKPRDYLRAGVRVLRDRGFKIDFGIECTVNGELPINAGVSSSSALVVGWLKFLLTHMGADVPPDELARLAHRAEVLEFNEPGGMMDHFTSSIGGTIFVDCKPPFFYESLPVNLNGFVLGDSLERKETLEVLRRSHREAEEGVKRLKEIYPPFDLRKTPLEEVEGYLGQLPSHLADKVYVNIRNRDICLEAKEMLTGGEIEPERLGFLLTRHHEMLKILGVSTAKLDALCEASLEAGALGAKLVGSGGGGCMVAYAPGREEEVARAIEEAGGKAYIVNIEKGCHSKLE